MCVKAGLIRGEPRFRVSIQHCPPATVRSSRPYYLIKNKASLSLFFNVSIFNVPMFNLAYLLEIGRCGLRALSPKHRHMCSLPMYLGPSPTP